MDYNEIVEGVAAYWDKRASTFDKDHDTEDLDVWRAQLAELLGPDTNKTVLDLGTGSGFLSNMLNDLGYHAVGVDISLGMMEYGVRHARAQEVPTFFMMGDAGKLPFLSNSVDYIVNARLIWTIPQPERMLKEWLRVLKPGGKIFCFNRMAEGVGMTTKPGTTYASEEVYQSFGMANATFDELNAMVEGAGFEDAACVKLDEHLTRAGYDWDFWYALVGTKPYTKDYREECGLADYWDSSAATYEARHELHDESHWHQVLSQLVGPQKDAKILDVATGTGMMANFLGSAGYTDITGVDISEQMMRIAQGHAKERGLNIDFVYGSTLDLPFCDASQDVVISSRLLWTLTEPEKAVAEWARVLKPGGRVVAINEVEPEGIVLHSIDEYCKKCDLDDLPMNNVTNEGILDLFAKYGFGRLEAVHMDGCRMESSDVENWFAFVGVKE